jgi:hypothetical protein
MPNVPAAGGRGRTPEKTAKETRFVSCSRRRLSLEARTVPPVNTAVSGSAVTKGSQAENHIEIVFCAEGNKTPQIPCKTAGRQSAGNNRWKIFSARLSAGISDSGIRPELSDR